MNQFLKCRESNRQINIFLPVYFHSGHVWCDVKGDERGGLGDWWILATLFAPVRYHPWICQCLKKKPYASRWRGMQWHSWLRHCTTSQKVVGSIPDGVIGIFHWHNPSSCNMDLGLIQPLTEMSTRNTSWGVKVDGAQGWQPNYLHVPTVLKSGSLYLLEPSGASPGLWWDCFTLCS
jgi:hypothetical protein